MSYQRRGSSRSPEDAAIFSRAEKTITQMEADASLLRRSGNRELKEEEIKGQIRRDALEHPLTVFPIVLALLSLFYLVFISPFLGGATAALAALGVAVGACLIGISFFGWRWLIKGKSFLKEKTQEILSLQQKAKAEELQYNLEEKRRKIEDGLKAARSSEGLKELGELYKEYKELKACFAAHCGFDVVSVEQLSALADNTYSQGLEVLETALEIMRGVSSSDITSLEEDIKQIEGEMGRLQKTSPQDPILPIKERTLASHEKRLATMKGQQIYVARLLAQSDECEAALCQTRLDLNVLSIEQASGKGQEVVERLQRVIELAKSVQAELKRMEGLNV